MIERHSHSGRGGDGERIDYNSLKNIPEASATKYFQDYDNRWLSAYSGGNFTITTGFRPKRIDIKGTISNNNEGATTGTAIIDSDGNIEQGSIYMDGSFGGSVWRTSGTVIGVISGSSLSTVLTVTAVSDTGFTLNVSNNNWLFHLVITAEG